MYKAVLLADGILDALVLDLQNRRATRANDLLLEEEGDQLQLRAADTGFGAILRRLNRGRYGPLAKNTLYDWKYVEFLRGDPEPLEARAANTCALVPATGRNRSTHRFSTLPDAAELITLLADPKAADTLERMSPERQLQVFEELARTRLFVTGADGSRYRDRPVARLHVKTCAAISNGYRGRKPTVSSNSCVTRKTLLGAS